MKPARLKYKKILNAAITKFSSFFHFPLDEQFSHFMLHVLHLKSFFMLQLLFAVAPLFLENYFATLLFLCLQRSPVSFLNVKHFFLFQRNAFLHAISLHIFLVQLSFYDTSYINFSLTDKT